MSKRLMIFLSAFLAVACGQKDDELYAYRAEMRVKLFRECLAVLTTIQRQGDNNVAEEIVACDQASTWQSAGLKRVMK